MLAEGLTYPKAVELIKRLAENGIDANITVGAVRLNPTLDKVDLTRQICAEFGAAVVDASTSTLAQMQEMARAEKCGKKIDVSDWK